MPQLQGMTTLAISSRRRSRGHRKTPAFDLAHIYTILGNNEAALERLEYLLANSSYLSAPYLRMDPKWDPLRDDPRFEALLETYDTAR